MIVLLCKWNGISLLTRDLVSIFEQQLAWRKIVSSWLCIHANMCWKKIVLNMIYCRKNSDQTQYLEMITCETVAKNKKTMIVIATIMDNLVSGVDNNVSQLVKHVQSFVFYGVCSWELSYL